MKQIFSVSHALAWMLVLFAQIGNAATYTVSNTDDSGSGSLRQAIMDANGNSGADIIEFSVAGTLNLSSGLPSITDALTIDGTTAPGYVAGTPTFIIDGDVTVFTCSNPTSLTIKGLDLSKSGAQGGTGFDLYAATGTVAIQDCKVNNWHRGIVCIGNANWTVTDNDLTASGYNHDHPALYFHSVTTGTIDASDNLFGGTGANTALRLHNCSDKIIGDENASPAAHILIKDADGLTNMTGNSVAVYVTNSSELTFDNLSIGKKTVPAAGTGIQFDNCSGTVLLQNLTVIGNNEGIILNSASADFTVTCSAIFRNNIGVRVYNAQSATVSNNNFKENANRSVLNSWGSQVNAENNYWLNPDGSTTHADAVNGYSGDVDADPALSAPAGCAPAFPASIRYYVDVDATGANDGTSWEDAFTNLQSAVNIAYAGDVIWVAEGTYYPTSDGNQGVYFLLQGGVKIYGGFDGTEDELTDRVLAGNETILSGDIGTPGDASDNSDILMATSYNSPDTRVDGFTFSGADNGYTSGALSIGSGTVAYCTFRNNTAYAGGGLGTGGGALYLERCLFHDNYGGAGGGAINSGAGTLNATNCIFHNNRAGDSGGVLFNQNGGVNATFTNCLFYGHTANYDGSVMFVGGGSNVNLDHCTVVGNNNRRALAFFGTGSVKNCIIWGNPLGAGGGGGTTATNSVLQDYIEGTGNRYYENPQFVNADDPDGADDIFGTSDDGLVPGVCSPAIDGALAPSPTLDLAGNARVDAPVIGVSPADIGAYEQLDVNYPAVITDIALENISVLADNGTICTVDDAFTADVVVTFTNISSTGNLSITSSQLVNPLTPVAMGSTTTATTHTFVGVTFTAFGWTQLTAAISDMPCTYSEAYNDTPTAGIGEVECTTCGTQWYDDGGPTGDYSDNIQVSKTFCPQTTDHKAQLEFVALDLTGYDYISIYDGPNGNGGYLGYLDVSTPISTFTATLANATGCLSAYFYSYDWDGEPVGAGFEANFNCVRIFDITMDNASACNGSGTTCGTDDTYTADITVHFASKPASGTLTLSGADIVGSLPTPVDVTSLAGNSHTFTGLTLRADEQSTDLSASFSEEASVVFSKNAGNAAAPCSGPKEIIIAVDPYDYTVDKYLTSTWERVASVDLSLDGYSIDAVNGLALNPVNNTYYAIIKTSGNVRRLVTVDIETGVCTYIGNLGGNFSSITFGTDGTLYGAQGSGGDYSLYTIDPSTAAKTFQTELYDYGGQVIAFNPADGFIYHFTYGYMDKIDPTDFSSTVIETDGDYWDYPFGAAYAGNGKFYLSDYDNYMYSVTTAGVSTELHYFDGDYYQRGFVLGSLPGPACNVSDISAENFSACIFPDQFTADVTVSFEYAPGTGDLTLKRGTTVLATKSAADLACLSEWTFTGVQMTADGQPVILTAEFDGSCTFTSSSLGTAPMSCNCTAPSISCPANVSVATTAGACTGVATWTAPTPTGPCNPMADGSHTSGSTFAEGTTTVTYTATNDESQTASCSFTVTVLDVLHHAQEVQRMASDGAASDNLGWGLGLDGTALVAGAPNDKVGTQSKQGSAYVFLQNQGGTDNWGQLKQIKASDGAAVDYFGNSIAVDGDFALVAAYGDNVGTITDAGSAYIYEKDLGSTNNWGQRTNIIAKDGSTSEAVAYDYFGSAVSLKNGRAVIGANKKKVGTNTAQGAAYIYEQNVGGANAWGNVKKLVASDGAANNFFGQSVAQAGDVVLVGASGHNSNRGAAYIFGKDTGGAGNWGQAQKLTASDAAVGDGFGTSVSLASDCALIGAMNKATYTGAAYIFKNTAGTWSQVKKLTASDGAINDRFGASVALSGDYAYVTALRANSGAGAVYVFHKNAGGTDNWGEIGKYTPSGGASGDQFGYALAVSGERMALSANLDDVAAKADQGSVYVFKGEDCSDVPKPSSATTSQTEAGTNLTSVKCSPNPFTDELTIEIAQSGVSNLASEIRVMDAVGRLVARVELPAGQTRHTLRTDALHAGAYFVQVSSEASVRVVPVVLVR
ncbi:MAG: right-handed parallel beta-helix repeat-containing protein [Saprospiraceae bacterium]